MYDFLTNAGLGAEGIFILGKDINTIPYWFCDERKGCK